MQSGTFRLDPFFIQKRSHYSHLVALNFDGGGFALHGVGATGAALFFELGGEVFEEGFILWQIVDRSDGFASPARFFDAEVGDEVVAFGRLNFGVEGFNLLRFGTCALCDQFFALCAFFILRGIGGINEACIFITH